MLKNNSKSLENPCVGRFPHRTFPLPDIFPTAYLMPPDNAPPATNDM